MFEILNRYTKAVLYRSETADTTKVAIAQAIADKANLAGANLAGANLAGANLAGANLSGANLSRADLYGANLAGANLAGANLAGANLAGASLSRANLSGADLSRADLSGANLYGADGLLPRAITPLQIFGTRHHLIVRTPGIIQIGCEAHAPKWWREHYKAVGRRECYTPAQIKEYVGHLVMAERWMKLHGVFEKAKESK